MIDTATQEFIRIHRKDNVRRLALEAAKYPHVDIPVALDQIQGWQIATRKCPLLARYDGIIDPPHLSMEQCSSQQTAFYKTRLVRRLLGKDARHTMTDLTGGFGIDFLALSLAFQQATYVELNPTLCELMRHNLQVLRRTGTVICGNGAEWVAQMPHTNLIYIDPARRGEGGKRTYAIADCTPDVLSLRQLLVTKADKVLIKLSPMLDWHEAVRLLEQVEEVHLVAAGGECKEMLVVLSEQATGTPAIVCANEKSSYRFMANTEQPAPIATTPPEVGTYLYEPNAAIMKSGCFAQLCEAQDVLMAGHNSHLFLAPSPRPSFPGRQFRIEAVTTMNKRELKTSLQSIQQANITVRNFPLNVAELRKRLHLADGGPHYIFATTLADQRHILILCKKIR